MMSNSFPIVVGAYFQNFQHNQLVKLWETKIENKIIHHRFNKLAKGKQ